MATFRILCGLLLLLALTAGTSFAQDTSDLYLQAYQDFQTAQKLESEGKPREALSKYQDAGKALEQIRRTASDWQPLVVEYRSKKTEEAIQRLQAEVASLPPEPVDTIDSQMPKPDRETMGLPQVVTPRATPSRPARSTDTGGSTARGGDSEELRRLRRQVDQLQKDNERLTQKVEEANGNLKMALMTNEKLKVSLVEVKSDLAQSNARLEDASRDGSSGAAARAEFDKKAQEIIKRLSALESEKQVLEEENARLLAELDKAATYIKSSDEIRAGLEKDRKKLEEERKLAETKSSKVRENSADLEKLTKELKDLQTQLAEVRKTADAKTADADKLLRENKVLTNKLAEAILTAPTKDQLARQNAVRNAERNTLLAKIAELEKSKGESPAANAEKDRQIAALQSDLNTANDRLLETQAQVASGDEKLRDLQKQLDQATGELAELRIDPKPSREQKNLIAENELLRNIILRQIKDQARRDEARKTIETVMAASPMKLDIIRENLAVLGSPVVELREEEKQLFKDPVALITQPAGEESLSITMAVTKPTVEQAEQNKKPPAAVSEALPGELSVRFEEAKKLFESGDFAGAERVFQELIETAPQNYYILSNLGAVQIESGKLSAAEVALRKAVTLKPNDSYAHRNLGIVYSRQGRIDDAIGALRQAVTADDKDAVAHNYLGVCLGQKDERREAEKQFTRAITIDPKYASAHFNLAVLYATSQPPDFASARKHYQKATALGAPPDASLERLIQ